MPLISCNTMVGSAIAANWMDFPVPTIVPSHAMSNPRESTAPSHSQTDVARLVRNRLLRLELLVATAIVGFGCFAGRTVTWENAFRQKTLDRNQSLRTLTANLARQDRRISDLTQSLAQANRDLSAQMNVLSRRLQEQQSQMTAIDSRLRRVEAAVK